MLTICAARAWLLICCRSVAACFAANMQARKQPRACWLMLYLAVMAWHMLFCGCMQQAIGIP
jgi:hypothetical protein